jgi:6-phosphogluconolactonase (cycloisomerase 2 family)
MKKLYLILIITFVLLQAVSFGQVTYIKKFVEQGDGVYGLSGPAAICLSPDKKNVYVTSQYALSVFSYDSTSGNLTFLTSYRDSVDGFKGLYGAKSVIVSPDNKNVYTLYHQALSIMTRDTATGLLTYYRLVSNINALSLAYSMVITKNSKYVLVTSEDINTVSVFLRNTVTGNLTFLQQYPSQLSDPHSIKLSNDNHFAYVLTNQNPSIAVFSLDTTNGAMTFIQNITNGQNGVSGLIYPSAIEISLDDKSLYAHGNGTLVSFTRNKTNGQLTFLQVINNNQNGVTGLQSCYGLSSTPDNRNVYLVSTSDSSVLTFNRDTATGSLSFVNTVKTKHPLSGGGLLSTNNKIYFTSYMESTMHIFNRNFLTGIVSRDTLIQNGDNATIDGLSWANYSCVSPDNKNVYVVSPYDGIAIFNRNDTTGAISFFKVIKCTANGINQLNNVLSMFISPDNRFAFFASSADSSIAIFNRDTITGDLTFWKRFNHANLNNINNIVISMDTNFIYASNHLGYLVTLKYNRFTSDITYLTMVDLSSFPPSGGSILKLQVSNNNKYLFAVTTAASSNLFMFVRDTTTGLLTYKTSYHGSFYENSNTHILKPFTVSNDCKSVYSVSCINNAIQQFNITNDSLVFVKETTFANTGIAGLKGPSTVEIDKDDKFVYVLSLVNNSISVFDRDKNSGNLSFVRSYKEPNDPVDGLDDGNFIAYSGDDRNFYVTSKPEHSVAAFKRDLFLGNDISACNGDTIKIEAGKFYSHYHWSTNDSLSFINVTSSGSYSVTITDKYGIIETDTINVIFHPFPVFDLGSDTSLCSGNSITLCPNGNFSQYLWSNGSTSQSTIITNSGVYTLTVTNTFGCIKHDSIYVNFWPLPVIEITNDQAICFGGLANITVSGTALNYFWNTGDIGDSITVSPSNTTTYYVTATDANNCSNTASATVTVFFYLPSLIITLNDSILASNCEWGNQWYCNGALIIGATNQYYTCTTNGTYYDVVTLNGCSPETSNTINVTNIGINDQENKSFINIYPNPTANNFTIEYPEKASLIILNMQGQTILQKEIQQGITDICITGLAKGVYILKLYSNNKTAVVRVIKE